MTIPRLYCPFPLTLDTATALPKNSSHHLLQVLRAQKNDPVILFNGQGGEYHGTLTDAKRHEAIITLTTFSNPPRESALTLKLGHGLSRSDRMDWVIQKAVELGISEITPLITTRASMKWDTNHAEKRLNHWQNIMVSAAEQSGRTVLPRLNTPLVLKDWCNTAPPDSLCLVGDIGCQTSWPHPSINPPTTIQLLIGSEGGLTPTEISSAHEAGFQSWSLGPRILRTETAAIAAIALLQARFGDLSPDFKK